MKFKGFKAFTTNNCNIDLNVENITNMANLNNVNELDIFEKSNYWIINFTRPAQHEQEFSRSEEEIALLDDTLENYNIDAFKYIYIIVNKDSKDAWFTDGGYSYTRLLLSKMYDIELEDVEIISSDEEILKVLSADIEIDLIPDNYKSLSEDNEDANIIRASLKKKDGTLPKMIKHISKKNLRDYEKLKNACKGDPHIKIVEKSYSDKEGNQIKKFRNKFAIIIELSEKANEKEKYCKNFIESHKEYLNRNK